MANNLENKSSSEVTYFIEKRADSDNPPFIVVSNQEDLATIENPNEKDIAIVWNLNDLTTPPKIAQYSGNKWVVDKLVGKDGKKGDDGADGTAPAYQWNGTSIRFQNPDGSWGAYVDLIGTKGDKGLKGDAGNAGLPPAHQWSGTAIRFQNADGSWGTWVELKGLKGDTGNKGETGGQGLPPAHRWTGTVLQFRNPDGSWAAGVDLKGQDGEDGQAGQQGLPPEHQIENQSIRFQKPDGTWGNWISLANSDGVAGVKEIVIGEQRIKDSVKFSVSEGIDLTYYEEDNRINIGSAFLFGNGVKLDPENQTISQTIEIEGSGRLVTSVQQTAEGFRVRYGDVESADAGFKDFLVGEATTINLTLDPADGIRLKRLFYEGAAGTVLTLQNQNPILGERLIFHGTPSGIRFETAGQTIPILNPISRVPVEIFRVVKEYQANERQLTSFTFTNDGWLVDNYSTFVATIG